MRKIITTTFVTLDGVMQAPGAPKEDTSGGFTQDRTRNRTRPLRNFSTPQKKYVVSHAPAELAWQNSLLVTIGTYEPAGPLKTGSIPKDGYLTNH